MEYSKLSPQEIYNNKEILKNFLILYSEKTGEQQLNAGCISCIADYQKKLYFIMETENKNYVLSQKYDGMFWINDYITNSKLTDKIAKEIIAFYKDEPISEMFSKYPKEKEKEKEKQK